ncbi:hypothetical protein CALCODRAFT_504753 [Calocera cornea HHB12733]|uniref:MYND-type domain-containing protein n=1 Tax=Calocera cornea HHB12733 TaxID=1353952 RepID=A0A165C8T1_9BASI|nr:hypothetical protein CALCODRAFT_504753 [Calocera cornea HHB12733]
MLSSGQDMRAIARNEVDILERVIGFRPGSFLPEGDVWDRMEAFRKYSEAELEVIYCRLGVSCLPWLVNGLLESAENPNNRPLWIWINVYWLLLCRIDGSAPQYMYRFMHSGHPLTKNLARRAAEIMCSSIERHGVELPSDAETGWPKGWPYQALDNMVGAGVFLLSLVSLSPPESRHTIIDSRIKSILLPAYLSYSRHEEPSMAQGFDNILALLESRMPAVIYDNYCLKGNGRTNCKRRGCSAKYEDGPWFQCSRCMTVAYCSKKHQTEDWDDPECPHKAVCYRTSW